MYCWGGGVRRDACDEREELFATGADELSLVDDDDSEITLFVHFIQKLLPATATPLHPVIMHVLHAAVFAADEESERARSLHFLQ